MEILEQSPSMIKDINVLLFDLDGTLVEMDESFRLPLILRGAKRFSGFLSLFKYPFAIYRAIKAMKKNESGKTNYEIFCSSLLADAKSDDLAELEKILQDLLEYDFKKTGKYFYPTEGAEQTLKTAKKLNYRCILATNPMFPLEAVKFRLKCGGFEDFPFEFITHSQNSTTCKPKVSYYQELVDKLKLDPSKCLMIGNDPYKDLPAAEIGIRTFLLDGEKFKKNINRYDKHPFLFGSHKNLEELLRSKV